MTSWEGVSEAVSLVVLLRTGVVLDGMEDWEVKTEGDGDAGPEDCCDGASWGWDVRDAEVVIVAPFAGRP